MIVKIEYLKGKFILQSVNELLKIKMIQRILGKFFNMTQPSEFYG